MGKAGDECIKSRYCESISLCTIHNVWLITQKTIQLAGTCGRQGVGDTVLLCGCCWVGTGIHLSAGSQVDSSSKAATSFQIFTLCCDSTVAMGLAEESGPLG